MLLRIFLDVATLVVLFASAVGRDLTDEEYFSLPDLFHLDDYEKCMANDGGVYCLGTFHATPFEEPNPIYHLMKEYSKETYAFNHTLLHRGYCISSRCPNLQPSSHNTSHLTTIFEQCTSKIAKDLSLQVQLTSLKYCRTRAKAKHFEISLSQAVFLAVVILLLIMNVVGTIFDIRTRENPKRQRLLLAWSVIKNWKMLTSNEKSKPSALTALHGIRVCVAISSCLIHSALIYFSLFLYKPRFLEHAAAHPLSMLVQNSTGAEQMFVVLSTFLYAHQLRRYAEKHHLNYRLLPMFVVKRIVRLSPVTFLVIGFAATWWPELRGGPVWMSTVGAESKICQQKFWTHLLFVNNLVDAEHHCVLPTWYIAVDIQMHILSTCVMLAVLTCRRVLVYLGLLFVGSCVMTAALAYVFHWTPMLYIATQPEILRYIMRDLPSFVGLYISPWGNMSACFLGLFVGYLYYDMKNRDFKVGRNKWLENILCMLSMLSLWIWVLMGYYLQHIRSEVFMAAYAVLERSFFQIIFVLSYVIFSFYGGFVIKMLSWRGWTVLSRMSLSAMTLHWLVSFYLVGGATQPMPTTFTDIGLYGISTAVYTYVLALPITILVEMPMKEFFDVIAS